MGNIISDIDISMKSTTNYVYESDYIPICLSGDVRGEFVVEIDTSDESENNARYIPIDIKLGTKKHLYDETCP